jgi:hypothetical protein
MAAFASSIVSNSFIQKNFFLYRLYNSHCICIKLKKHLFEHPSQKMEMAGRDVE